MKCENEIDGNCTESLDRCTGCEPPAASDCYPVLCGEDTICKALESRLEGANFETSKGFCTVHVVNIATNKTRLFGVGYKTRKADKGVMLNFCPFCGQHPGEFQG